MSTILNIRALSLPVALLVLASMRPPLGAQAASPRAQLRPAPGIVLPGEADSNSPAVWEIVAGRPLLHVMTSAAGMPSIASGTSLTRLGEARRIGSLEPWPGGGVWMEAVVPDVDGTWYGYYHNELPAAACEDAERTVPRIGAARSRDRGQTWADLGLLLEAPPISLHCDTSNKFFVGGVGDISVMLDLEIRVLYIFFSEYLRMAQLQGVGIARLAWADRDAPVGKLMVWRSRVWLPASRAFTTSTGEMRWSHQVGLPIFPVAAPWHDEDPIVDAFWGPSVHWNTHLQQYVMLLNRAMNEEFEQEGIYITFAPSLEDPRLWSPPTKLLSGGRWYPQVIGTVGGTGTDKSAGEIARFFMAGLSEHVIRFVR
jgi:hypothetical protein